MITALSGRRDMDLEPILKFATKHILESSSTEIIREMVDTLLDIYGDLLCQSGVLAPALGQLRATVSAQVALRPAMMQLTGQIQLLSAT